MPIPYEVTYRNSSSPRSLCHITTQDLHPTSPTPRFEIERSRRRSLSPIPDSPPMASKTMYSPPPLTWSTAAQDAKAGICYTKDVFPTSSFLPPPFSREPVSVEAAERVEVLEEIDEYAVRVRVLRTGAVGLIPAWNTEGALERLTRINTAFNEAATCPVEARALRRRDSESSARSVSSDGSDGTSPPPPPADTALTHVHARCVPFATRVRYPDYYGLPSPFSDSDGDSDSDSDVSSPLTPQSPPSRGRSPFRSARRSDVGGPAVYEAPASTVEKGAIPTSGGTRRERDKGVGSPTRLRSGQEANCAADAGRPRAVVFRDSERPRVVFRYPSEELVLMEGLEKLAADSDRAEAVRDEEEADDEWWWRGWEEPTEESELKEDQEDEAMACAGPEGEEGTSEKLISATFDVRGVFEPLKFHPEDL